MVNMTDILKRSKHLTKSTDYLTMTNGLLQFHKMLYENTYATVVLFIRNCFFRHFFTNISCYGLRCH